MTRTLLVVPTGHGVGLTASCLGLVSALRRQGVDVGFGKPLAQPRAPGTGADRSTALMTLTSGLRPPEPIPAELVEQPAQRERPRRADGAGGRRGRAGHRRHDVVILEGLVPATGLVYASRVNLALAKAFDADVLLVGAAGDAGRAPRREHGDRRPGPTRQASTTGWSARWSTGCRTPARQAVEALRKALAERGLALVGSRSVPDRADLAPAVRHRGRPGRHAC